MAYDVDKIKDTITTTAGVVAKKSSELYERAKISLTITGIKNDIDKLYNEIGKMVYEGRNDEMPSELIEQKCNEIDEKFEAISALRSERAAYKNVKVCPACGAEVSPQSTYCANCGEKF